jgi:pyridoxine 5-phosphate synthase
MIRLSVNLNKIATLRNSRGGETPSVLEALDVCLAAGAPGITVHPRADERHIRPADVTAIAARLAEFAGRTAAPVEFNIEGDPRPDWLDMVERTRPTQCTLVPVQPGEITSQAGWTPGVEAESLRPHVTRLRRAGIRVSLFIDPQPEAVRWAVHLGADRVELYTEPFARAVAGGDASGREAFHVCARAATLAHEMGLGVNAGHDLDLANLRLFRTLPYLDEVSIGHALISRALWVGLDQSVRDFLAVLQGTDERAPR